MKIKNKKAQILLDSFEILKDDFSKNRKEISTILEYFFREDVNIAFEMWDFLLTQYTTETYDSDSIYYLIPHNLYQFTEDDIVLTKKILNDFRKHNIIIEKVFSKSQYIRAWYGYYGAFLRALPVNGLEDDFAYFLDLLMQNQTPQIKTYRFGLDSSHINSIIDEPNSLETVILLSTLDHMYYDVSENIINIIYSYVEKITNKLFRAKLNVALSKIMK